LAVLVSQEAKELQKDDTLGPGVYPKLIGFWNHRLTGEDIRFEDKRPQQITENSKLLP